MTTMLGPVVMDLAATELTADEVERLRHPLVGGVIFFSRNFTDVEQLQRLVADVRRVRPELLLMVDQEGGRVQRFKKGFTKLPPLQVLGALYRSNPEAAISLARQHAWMMASEVLSVGLDLSLAPVLDCDVQFSRVIGDRAFAEDPHIVSELGAAYIKAMANAGMSAVGKHFPGHGIVEEDSHLSLPISDVTLAEIEASHMLPFRQLASRLAGVMPAHMIFNQVDSFPVGFSRFWVEGLLKNTLGFAGVVFSDDLSMAGAAWAGTFAQRAEVALAAGCDALLVCNQPQAVDEVLAHCMQLGVTPNDSLAKLRGGPALGQGLDALQRSKMWQNCQHSMVTLGDQNGVV